MKTVSLLLWIWGIHSVSAFVTPLTSPAHLRIRSVIASPPTKLTISLSTSPSVPNVLENEISMPSPERASIKERSILLSAMVVGTAASSVGYLYHIFLKSSAIAVWKTLPTFLETQLGRSINPILFIPAVVTTGGLISGILTGFFPHLYSASDFVTSFSQEPALSLPSSRVHLIPGLFISLLSSAFGFSKDPEAPLVGAGTLIGSSLARHLHGKGPGSEESKKRCEESLAYAGAAGTVTGFMGVPIVGSIFSLEMTRSNVGINRAADRALAPAVVASIAALTLVLGIIKPFAAVGGHFSYGTVGKLAGRAMLTTAFSAGIGGAVIGTAFHKLVAMLKRLLWRNTKNEWRRQIIVKTFIGFLVGCIGVLYPQSLFWGEEHIQSMVDGQMTAFTDTFYGIPRFLSNHLNVIDPSIPFQTWSAGLQIGFAKFVAVVLAGAGKFSGGIVWPLFCAAAPIAHSFSSYMSPGALPVAIMSLMAATQASATRTPLGSALLLAFTASSKTDLGVMLPAALVASYTSVFVSRMLSRKAYFHYKN